MSDSEKPKVKLIGEDGNVFTIIGKVRRALLKAHETEKAREFMQEVEKAEDYDAVLRLAMQYCDVE